jgi:hypothetical protein
MENTAKQTESWFQKNKVSLGVAIGALIALGTGIAVWSFNRGRAYPEIPDPNMDPASKIPKIKGGFPVPNNNPIPGIASDKPNYINKIRILRSKVADETKKGELDMNTIVLIHEALMDITEEDFGKLIVENRVERRAVIRQDDAQYEALVVKGAEGIEKLISEKIQIVLRDCEATTQLYERSCQSWANKNPQFAMMSILMIEKMKTKIPKKGGEAMTLTKAKDMMKYQIEQYPQIKVNVNNRQVYPLVKQSFLSDITAEKFGFEEEDLAGVPGLSQDAEVRQLAQQLQTLMQMDAFSMMGGN